MDGSEYRKIYNYISSNKYPEKFNENEKRTLRRKCQNYKIKMEGLYYIYKDKKAEENIDKLVVHRDKLDTVLYMCHDESGCHLGVNKTASKIASKYYFPNIIDTVRKYIATCDKCQKQNKKAKTIVPVLCPVSCGKRIWGKIGIDLVGPFLNQERQPISTNGYRLVSVHVYCLLHLQKSTYIL
jgi:hypothetical protein